MTDTQLATVPRTDIAPARLTAVEVRARVNLIQEVMRGVMKVGTHYGKIPGAGDKPTLLKPGAEVILTTFQLAVEPVVEDLSTADCVRYRVHARGIHQNTGALIGVGIGECSSDETKYRWRAAVCPQEFEATPEDRRRKVWKRGNRGTYTVDQVRTEPSDVANTVLKMAKKRAQVDLCLTATAASDCFTQDIEDLPEELRGELGDDGPGEQEPGSRRAPPRQGNAGVRERMGGGKSSEAPDAAPGADAIRTAIEQADDFDALNAAQAQISRIDADDDVKRELRRLAMGRARELSGGGGGGDE